MTEIYLPETLILGRVYQVVVTDYRFSPVHEDIDDIISEYSRDEEIRKGMESARRWAKKYGKIISSDDEFESKLDKLATKAFKSDVSPLNRRV